MIIFLRKMRKMKHFSLGDRKGRPYAEVIDKLKFAALSAKTGAAVAAPAVVFSLSAYPGC